MEDKQLQELIEAAKRVVLSYNHAREFKYDERKWEEFDTDGEMLQLGNALISAGVNIPIVLITTPRLS